MSWRTPPENPWWMDAFFPIMFLILGLLWIFAE